MKEKTEDFPSPFFLFDVAVKDGNSKVSVGIVKIEI